MRLDHLLSMEKVRSHHEGSRISHRLQTDAGTECEYLVRCSIFSDLAEALAAEEPRGCSSAGRAPALQAGGQGFDSPHLHQSASSRKVREERESGTNRTEVTVCSSGG